LPCVTGAAECSGDLRPDGESDLPDRRDRGGEAEDPKLNAGTQASLKAAGYFEEEKKTHLFIYFLMIKKRSIKHFFNAEM